VGQFLAVALGLKLSLEAVGDITITDPYSQKLPLASSDRLAGMLDPTDSAVFPADAKAYLAGLHSLVHVLMMAIP
jgi:hypothetical protein